MNPALEYYLTMPIWKWKMASEVKKKYKIRSLSEIEAKLEEFKLARLELQKKDKQTSRYDHCIEAIQWVLNAD